MPIGPTAPSVKPNNKRSKNFSVREDEVLISGWLNISLDPIVGKDQKGGRYWARIHDYFIKHNTCNLTRTLNSLMHRWETIQKSVNKFFVCLTRILLLNQSGTNTEDKVAAACAMYKKEDEYEKLFQFMHCWNKLRTQPKWLAKLDELAAGKTTTKKQNTRPTAEESARLPSETGQDEVQGQEDNVLARLTGRKKAKEEELNEKKKRSVAAAIEKMWAEKKEAGGEKELKKDERFNKALALEQERAANEKLLVEVRRQEVELQNKRDEERIMTIDLSVMPEEQKKYYMGLRVEIMSRVFI